MILFCNLSLVPVKLRNVTGVIFFGLRFVPVPTEGYSAYVDVDCYGNDIKSVAKPSALDCSRECDEIVTCVGFIYTTSNYCHIKFLCETSSFTPLNNVVLYIKTGFHLKHILHSKVLVTFLLEM